MRRLLWLCVGVLSASPGVAWALPPCNQPGPCDPSIPPPPVDGSDFEREARSDPTLQEQQRRNAWQSVDQERRQRADQEARLRRENDAPLRSPVIELGALMRVRGMGKRQYHLGPALRLGVYWDELYFLEVQGSLTRVSDRNSWFTMWYAEPSFGAAWSSGGAHVMVYAGLVTGGRTGDTGPTFQVGPKVGLGATYRLIPLLDGYLGATWGVEGGIVGGWGASETSLNTVRGFFGTNLGLVVAL